MDTLRESQQESYIDGRDSADLRGFVTVLLDYAEAMLLSGAEVYRTEDTARRIGNAYGAMSTDVFAITSSILITVEMPDGQVSTQSRRILGGAGNNFTRLDALNALSREYCASPFPVDVFARRLRAIMSQTTNSLELLVGNVGVGVSFAVFFGGTAQDAVLAGAGGALIWVLQVYFAPLCMNGMVYTFLAAFLMGLAVSGVGRLWPIFHIDEVIMGDIMLLIPGSMTVNAVRDFLFGDTLSGILRLIQALFLAGVLALGVVCALGLLR